MRVTPNAKTTGIDTIALDATRVQIDQRSSDLVEVNIQRPDGGTTTVVMMGANTATVLLRFVGHSEPTPHAEQEVVVGGGETQEHAR